MGSESAMAMVEDFTVALGQTAQGRLPARVSQNTVVMGTSDESLVSFNSVTGMVGSCTAVMQIVLRTLHA